MWLDQTTTQELASDLREGKDTALRLLLESIIGHLKSDNDSPFCPKCGSSLIQKKFLVFPLKVKTCPNGHGMWISREQAHWIKSRLHRSSLGQLPIPHAPRKFLALISYFIIVIATFLYLSWERPESSGVKVGQNKLLGAAHWPGRDFSRWNPLPLKNKVIDAEELSYFRAWTNILNEGIVNRLNIQETLDTRRNPEDYPEVFQFYESRQSEFLRQLRALEPPARLGVFHDLVVEATISQIAFYKDYAQQKADQPKVVLKELLEHRRLKECDQKLWAAYHEFQRLYPGLDASTNNAIEQRLCWLDVI